MSFFFYATFFVFLCFLSSVIRAPPPLLPFSLPRLPLSVFPALSEGLCALHERSVRTWDLFKLDVSCVGRESDRVLSSDVSLCPHWNGSYVNTIHFIPPRGEIIIDALWKGVKWDSHSVKRRRTADKDRGWLFPGLLLDRDLFRMSTFCGLCVCVFWPFRLSFAKNTHLFVNVQPRTTAVTLVSPSKYIIIWLYLHGLFLSIQFSV